MPLNVNFAGDETTGKRDFKMMCVCGYSSDVVDAINLDEKLNTSSKLPPNDGQFEKSFSGMHKFYNFFL